MKFFNFRFLRLWLLICIEVLKRNKYKLIISFSALFFLIFAQVKLNLFYSPNAITLGFIGTYQEHDLPLEVTKLVSQNLVEADKDGRIRGKLVSGWDTNNDATLFKFKLWDNLKWVDGSPISSKDLEFGFPNVEVTAPDNKLIQFKLKEAYSPFPSLLTKPIFKRGTLIGTGPYKITKLEKSRIFITKLELKPKDSSLPVIYIRFYPSEKVAVTGFNLGEVQALLGFSNAAAFNGNPTMGLMQKTDYSKIVTVLFQTKDPMLSNRSLRQALSFVTPRIENEEVANNPYPPFLWAYNPDAKKYLANPKEAKEALERAKSNISEEKLKDALVLTATPNLAEAGEKIAKEWKSLGLDVKLRIESGIAQNFQSLLITQSIPLDPDQYFLWHATQQKTNLTKYDSKRADKDLEDGRKIITEEERKNSYFDFQKTLLEDAPAIFLYFPKYNIAYLKKSKANLDKVLSL